LAVDAFFHVAAPRSGPRRSATAFRARRARRHAVVVAYPS
jgi:hypothetical protein